MKRLLREVTEDQNQIKVLETIGYSLQMSDFDIGERDDEERWIGEMDDAVGGWKDLNVGTMRDTTESEFTHWNIDTETTIGLGEERTKLREEGEER